MYILNKRLLSGGLALYLTLSPVLVTAAPQQIEASSVTNISVSDLLDKQNKPVAATAEAKAAAAEDLAVAAVNQAQAGEMGAVITANAQVLDLDLTNYNLLTNKNPVHVALVKKRLRNASAVKKAFNLAVAKEKKVEAAAAEKLAVTAVNSAQADEMGAVITANAQVLGLDLTDYNLLTNKNPVHVALVKKRFRNASAVKKAFNSAVAKEKKTEVTAAEKSAITAVNQATADEMGAVLTAQAPALGLDLGDYNSLINKNPVHAVLVGKNFKNKAGLKKAFDAAVAAEKQTEKSKQTAAIAKIDKIAKGASAAGITLQDLIDAGVKAADVIADNLAAYQAAISAAEDLALNSTAKIQQMVTDVNGSSKTLAAAQKAVADLFTDGTKTALAAGVGQAAINAASEKVAALADGVAEKAGLLADIQTAQTLLDNGPPLINDVSSISGAELGENTLKFSLSKLTRNSGIGVSKNSKLSLKIDGVGPIGDFDLVANQTTNLLNSSLPAKLNLSDADFSAILEAIKSSDAVTKQQVFDEADFAKLFTLLKQSDSATKDAVLQVIDFNNLFATLQTTDSETRQRVMENIISIIDLAAGDTHKSEFKAVLIGIFSGMFPVLTTGQKQIVIAYLTSGSTTKLTDLFNSLLLTDVQKKEILSRIDYAKLFQGIFLLEQETRTKIFDILDFTDIFGNIKNSETAVKAKAYEDVLKILDTIKGTGLSKVDILNTITWGDIDRAALFQVMDNLDGTLNGFVTMEATLTDARGQSNKYTIHIDP